MRTEERSSPIAGRSKAAPPIPERSTWRWPRSAPKHRRWWLPSSTSPTCSTITPRPSISNLVSGLKYQTPALLFDAIAPFVPAGKLDILDLGCGTGLFGPQLRPLARTLTGIDLSSNMLKKAEQRQLYDQLICGDIAEFLEAQSQAFDLAVAADVFVYIGDLSRVFRGVRGALRDGGLFGFSVESTDEADFVLRTTLRYAHSVPYLEKLARDHRFVLERVEARVIRQEHEVDVNGYLAVMRCA